MTTGNRRIGRRPFASLALGAMLMLAACDEDAAATASPSPVQSTSAAEPTANADGFCAAAAPMLVAVPREHIGSDEHVAQFEALAAVAPEELVDDIALLTAHYRDDVSPANPESQNFENFPAPVQDAALRLDGELRERC